MNTAVIKTLTKISLIILAITLVYAAGFSMLHSGSHRECAAAKVIGDCSGGSNFLETATIHLDVLRRISTAALIYFALGIFAVFLILFAIPAAIFAEHQNKSLDRERLRLYIKTSSLRKKLDWLITCEKRDPSLRFAVSA